jgi:putative ABC transport system permease protein
LLLVRIEGRRQELAIRAALGADRRNMVTGLLLESLVLGCIGSAIGLGLAYGALQLIIAAAPTGLPRLHEIGIDIPVLLFTVALAIFVSVVIGMIPVLKYSGIKATTGLREGGRGLSQSRERHRARKTLVVVQVALALVLLICAGLLIQTFSKLGHVQPGLRTDRLLTASVQVPSASYPKNENVIAFWDRFLQEVRTLPGVESASAILPLPLSGANMVTDFDIEEHPLPEGQRPTAAARIIATDYFQTMGIPLLQGRAFNQTEKMDSTPVVIVNERFASKYFPGQNVIGKRITPGFSADDSPEKMREIVGVVGNVKHSSLKNEDSPELYLPRSQLPTAMMSVVIHTRVSDPATLTSAIRGQLTNIDPAIPLNNVRVFDQYISRSLARPRFNAFLLSIFAGSALLLTAIGIYGVMAYSVAQRTNEIGIRIALGASQSNIFKLVIGQAMTLVAISVVLGLAGAFAVTRLLGSMLFGVGAWDPITFGAIVFLISLVAFLAAWLPARRAARVDPIVALRAE